MQTTIIEHQYTEICDWSNRKYSDIFFYRKTEKNKFSKVFSITDNTKNEFQIFTKTAKC